MPATLFVLVTRFRMRAVKLCERGVKDSLGRLELPVRGAEIANEMSYRLGHSAAPAPYALPAGFAMFLAVGTVAAALHGRLPAGGVLIACAVVAFGVSFAAEPIASLWPSRTSPAVDHGMGYSLVGCSACLLRGCGVAACRTEPKCTSDTHKAG